MAYINCKLSRLATTAEWQAVGIYHSWFLWEERSGYEKSAFGAKKSFVGICVAYSGLMVRSEKSTKKVAFFSQKNLQI